MASNGNNEDPGTVPETKAKAEAKTHAANGAAPADGDDNADHLSDAGPGADPPTVEGGIPKPPPQLNLNTPAKPQQPATTTAPPVATVLQSPPPPVQQQQAQQIQQMQQSIQQLQQLMQQSQPSQPPQPAAIDENRLIDGLLNRMSQMGFLPQTQPASQPASSTAVVPTTAIPAA